ncbi:MAG: hypothetical protein U0S12_04225 [Fimbriimonadales bacterium]
MEWFARLLRVAVFRIKQFLRDLSTMIAPPMHRQRLPTLNSLVAAQQENKVPLDRVLLDRGFLGDREAQMARALKLGMPYVDLARIQVDTGLRSVVPLAMLVQHQVVPVQRKDNSLWLASSDPDNLAAYDAVRSLTGLGVIPVLALANEIEALLQKWSELP